MINTSTHRQFQHGSLLLIALVLLGVISVATVYVTRILLGEIKNARYADNSVISYYVAESGAEDALWRLKVSRNIRVCSDDDTQWCNYDSDCVSPATCIIKLNDDAGNYGPSYFSSMQGKVRCGAEDGGQDMGCFLDPMPSEVHADTERFFDYNLVSFATADYQANDIAKNQVASMDIFDPRSEDSADTSIDQLNVDWYVNSCSGTEGSARMEITLLPVGINPIPPAPPQTYIDVCGCVAGETGLDALTGLYRCDPGAEHSRTISVDSTKYYRVVFRPLDTMAKKITLSACSGAACDPVDIPSQMQIKVTGNYRESQSVITLRTNWKDPVSGVFSYVLFSEESLIKDTKGISSLPYGSTCAVCSDGVTGCSSNADCALTCDVLAGTCTNGTTPCTDDSQCSGFTCTTPQPAPLCREHTPPTEDDGSSSGTSGAVLQTDAGSCNAMCNGRTLCGDGTLQTPNGAGFGGQVNDGNEECDAGPSNSDLTPLTCRTSCRHPYCGDSVVDFGTYQATGSSYTEECDQGSQNSNQGLCNQSCMLTYCGDGFIQNPNGRGQAEVCDDGANNGTSCSYECQPI